MHAHPSTRAEGIPAIQPPTFEQCGIFAVWGHPEAAKLACLGLYALQHRGQESAGICASDSRHLVWRKSRGLVAEIFIEPVLDELVGTMAIGHTGDSTPGDSSHLNAQPFTVESNKGQIAMTYNGSVTSASQVRNILYASQPTGEPEVILHLMARSREPTLPAALREALLRVQGAYSLVMLAPNQMIVARDPCGFRPLAMGSLSYDGRECPVFASETCAFDVVGARYEGEVQPGEMVIVSPEGTARERFAPEKPRSHCVFEHVCCSRPDSVVFGRSVQESREVLGRLLAREHPADADLVVAVPDSGVAAALGYASESGIPYREGLIRNHIVGRTLIEHSHAIRDFGVELQLNPVRFLIEGRRVVLVDDTIVRGPAMRKIVRMVRAAGAREVHFRISCPPTTSPCFYGVDVPSRHELIASTHSVEEIRRFFEADSLAYLSFGGLRQAVGDTNGRFCYACYTSSYPTALIFPAEEPPAQEPMAEPEFVALTLFGNQLKLVSITPDGEYRFLDEAQNLHNILLYVYSSETKALQVAVEELEYLVNDPHVKEADLQDFFERNPDFVKNDEYKKAHARVVLTRENAEPLKPDFVLEPINQSRLCDLLELKHPLAQVFALKARRTRFSAAVFEACAQLREYSLYFDERKNRETIHRNYGLLAYKPRLFVIIGRRGSVSPIELRNMELDTPHLHLRTYDDLLERMKARIGAMKEGRWR